MKNMKKGYNQGDMKPEVKDYQPSEREFAGKQYGKTLDYVAKRDRIQNEAARKLNMQSYKGRYD